MQQQQQVSELPQQYAQQFAAPQLQSPVPLQPQQHPALPHRTSATSGRDTFPGFDAATAALPHSQQQLHPTVPYQRTSLLPPHLLQPPGAHTPTQQQAPFGIPMHALPGVPLHNGSMPAALGLAAHMHGGGGGGAWGVNNGFVPVNVQQPLQPPWAGGAHSGVSPAGAGSPQRIAGPTSPSPLRPDSLLGGIPGLMAQQQQQPQWPQPWQQQLEQQQGRPAAAQQVQGGVSLAAGSVMAGPHADSEVRVTGACAWLL